MRWVYITVAVDGKHKRTNRICSMQLPQDPECGAVKRTWTKLYNIWLCCCRRANSTEIQNGLGMEREQFTVVSFQISTWHTPFISFVWLHPLFDSSCLFRQLFAPSIFAFDGQQEIFNEQRLQSVFFFPFVWRMLQNGRIFRRNRERRISAISNMSAAFQDASVYTNTNRSVWSHQQRTQEKNRNIYRRWKWNLLFIFASLLLSPHQSESEENRRYCCRMSVACTL